MSIYKWYAIYTKSRAEKKVVEALNKKGIKSYLPIRIVERQWKDRRKKIESPIIASYVFVYIDLKNQRHDLYEIQGFVSFVSEKHAPKPIPDIEIETMRKAVDSSWVLEIDNSTLVNGQKVILKNEPMKGMEGIVKDVTSKKVHLVLPTVGITLILDMGNTDFDIVK